MNLNIPATKTNLLKYKGMLSFAIEGYELLDEKRKIILNEIENAIYNLDNIQKDLFTLLKEAYVLLDKTISTIGEKKLKELALSIDTKYDIIISKSRILGIIVPSLDLKFLEEDLYFSPIGVNFYVDELILKFKNILYSIIKLAERKYILLYLAKEFQKTIRKVNILDKIYIPLYKETLKYISNKLQEEAMESFCILKFIKTKLKN